MLSVAAGKLYFMGHDSLGQFRLFISDGSAGGTKAVTDAGLSNVAISNYIGGDQSYLLMDITMKQVANCMPVPTKALPYQKAAVKTQQ